MFKKDDIVVRVVDNGIPHNKGKIIKFTRVGHYSGYIEDSWSSNGETNHSFSSCRMATPEEVIAYNNGIKNISDIKEEEVNNNYLVF